MRRCALTTSSRIRCEDCRRGRYPGNTASPAPARSANGSRAGTCRLALGRPRGLPPMLMASAANIPYCREASTSKGSGLDVASTPRWTRTVCRARSSALGAVWTPAFYGPPRVSGACGRFGLARGGDGEVRGPFRSNSVIGAWRNAADASACGDESGSPRVKRGLYLVKIELAVPHPASRTCRRLRISVRTNSETDIHRGGGHGHNRPGTGAAKRGSGTGFRDERFRDGPGSKS